MHADHRAVVHVSSRRVPPRCVGPQPPLCPHPSSPSAVPAPAGKKGGKKKAEPEEESDEAEEPEEEVAEAEPADEEDGDSEEPDDEEAGEEVCSPASCWFLRFLVFRVASLICRALRGACCLPWGSWAAGQRRSPSASLTWRMDGGRGRRDSCS